LYHVKIKNNKMKIKYFKQSELFLNLASIGKEETIS